MSEVEGSITAHVSMGLLRAMTQLQNQAEGLAGAAKTAMEAIEQSLRASVPAPVKAEQPERFEHTDDDGDWFQVSTRNSKTHPWGLETEGDLVYLSQEAVNGLAQYTEGDLVYLSQEAVNGLAQYLDCYRTDQQDCDVEVPEQCGRANPPAISPGPAVDLNEFYCAGYTGTELASTRGCGHPRDQHGALGCTTRMGDRQAAQCPCERRNGS